MCIKLFKKDTYYITRNITMNFPGNTPSPFDHLIQPVSLLSKAFLEILFCELFYEK